MNTILPTVWLLPLQVCTIGGQVCSCSARNYLVSSWKCKPFSSQASHFSILLRSSVKLQKFLVFWFIMTKILSPVPCIIAVSGRIHSDSCSLFSHDDTALNDTICITPAYSQGQFQDEIRLRGELWQDWDVCWDQLRTVHTCSLAKFYTCP